MAIRFRRVSRLCDPTNKEAGKKVYPVISYQYDTSATLDEFAKEIASASGVSEGETISVLKDFHTVHGRFLFPCIRLTTSDIPH